MPETYSFKATIIFEDGSSKSTRVEPTGDNQRDAKYSAIDDLKNQYSDVEDVILTPR